jgi:hypothetical protein
MAARVRPWFVALALVTACGMSASGYLKFGTSSGGSNSTLHWARQPARYFVTDRGVAGVSATDLDAALARAFGTWHAVATADISFERGGFTGAAPFEPDGVSVIGFEQRPDLERTLGATTYTYDTRTGEITEADIFLNSNFDWSVSPGGQAGRFDVESIALHEIGHFVGLGHSALGETELRAGGGRRVIGAEAVMFPIAFSAGSVIGRTLRADDVAGVSDIYPAGSFRDSTGSVSGRVTKNGRGVFGAHIVAFNLGTGALVGGFSLSADGRFTIAGLAPGPTVLRAEPLDDGDVASFVADEGDVDVDFRVAYASRPVVVPAGGNVSDVAIAVVPK